MTASSVGYADGCIWSELASTRQVTELHSAQVNDDYEMEVLGSELNVGDGTVLARWCLY